MRGKKAKRLRRLCDRAIAHRLETGAKLRPAGVKVLRIVEPVMVKGKPTAPPSAIPVQRTEGGDVKLALVQADAGGARSLYRALKRGAH